MLHTLSSIYKAQSIKLLNNHYNTFDSSTFKSDKTMENTFMYISESFIRIFNKSIGSFLHSIMTQNNDYYKATSAVYTLEEAIFLKSLNINSNNIKQYHVSDNIRLFAVPASCTSDFSTENGPYTFRMDGDFNVIESLVYSNIAKSNIKILSIFIYENRLLNPKNNEELDTTLFKIMNGLALSYIDFILARDNNVILNRTYTYDFSWNNNSIVLPERISLTDSVFIYYYFKCIFEIILSIANQDKIKTFQDYLDRITILPELFVSSDVDDEQNPNQLYIIYEKIWKRAYNKIVLNQTDSNEDLINICTDIYNYILINIDEDYYYMDYVMNNSEERGDE